MQKQNRVGWWIGLLMAGLLLTACGQENAPASDAQSLPPVVSDFAVIAEGRLLPRDYATLGFLAGGKVVEVLVEEGDMVEAGAPLARLEDSQQLAAQRDANRVELLNAETALDNLLDETPYILAAAQARQDLATANDQLDDAQRRLNNLFNPNIEWYEDQVELARDALADADDNADLVELDQAQQNYYFAQENYTNIKEDYDAVKLAIDTCVPTADENCDPNRVITIGFIPWTLDDVTDALEDATNALTQAEIVLEQARRGSVNSIEDAQERLEDAEEDLAFALAEPKSLDVALAEAEVARWAAAALDAQERLDKALAGPDPDDVALAEQRIAVAEATLAATEDALARLQLTAPFAGTVAQLTLKVGEQVAPGQGVVVLADFSGWVVETDNLTEIEVVDVTEGQGAEIVLDALPDVTLTATVERIDVVFEEKRGDVTYTVQLALDEIDPAMRWGMTAVVTFDR